jgi:hypothetical protein|tara:strand:+ start:786 stop:1049 length:264 start_codon:yes stop_codon:yes gene_type:complete
MIPDRILEQINFVVLYVADCDDWVEIKKQILLGIPSKLRCKFSTRDPKTKEQHLNDFEKEIIQFWKEKTGITLKLRTLAERRDLFVF